LVEQVLGQQTAENRESILDNLIRQLQDEQDGREIEEPPAEEAEGMFDSGFPSAGNYRFLAGKID